MSVILGFRHPDSKTLPVEVFETQLDKIFEATERYHEATDLLAKTWWKIVTNRNISHVAPATPRGIGYRF
ncbi:hypothetical protein [Paraburkholderia elongata]|uniref:Uncharacterized protein n=1 Tax=Paraburkholderia elongata TaxID=2675747 RepID=A0A972NYU6_9BURK|nr:hypothetical protein [Paraburkholderia elongata]NPT62336.1 hypothetical protein [Paraburkholderia elongata]